MTGEKFGIVYGFEGSPDFTIAGPYPTIEAARAAYEPDRRVRSDSGLSGADLVRLGAWIPEEEEYEVMERLDELAHDEMD